MIALTALLKKIFRKKENKLDLVYPVSWETMDFDDFRSVCIVLSSPHGREETLFLCFCKLAGLIPDNPKKYDPKKLKNKMPFLYKGKSYVIGSRVISEAANQMSFILDQIGLPPSPFRQVDRHLFGISFKQFFEADSFILRAISDNENGAWFREAAKKLTRGQVTHLIPWQRKAIVLWWNGVKAYLKEKYPYVFQDGSGYSSKTQADILQELLSALNDNRPQNNEDILKCDVHSVLYSLNQIYNDAKRRLS